MTGHDQGRGDDPSGRSEPTPRRPLVIACGALASELRAVLAGDALGGAVDVHYLPAHLHNRPDGITPAVEAVLDAHAGRPTFVAYADCGTGGHLDAMLARHPGVCRLPGAHCYEVFAGEQLFARLHDDEPGTFFLTDFLARHFDALVWQGLGLDRHPALRSAYFGNYRRVVLLTQSADQAVVDAGRLAADKLSLAFEHHHVGRRGLAPVTTAVSIAIGRSAA